MEQTRRITHMEQLLDRGNDAAGDLEAALARYAALRPALEELFDYYFSPQWRQDLVDDEAGKLSPELPRGILSEDGIYDLYTRCRELDSLLLPENES